MKKIFAILIFCYSGLFSQTESNKIDLKEFAGLWVHDEGRIKPIDTLARSLLLRFNAKSTFKNQNQKLLAIEWFARVLFRPDSTRDDRIFKVNHPEVLNALGLKSKEKRFSFNDIQPSFQVMGQIANSIWEKGKKFKEQTGEDYKRDPFEKEFMRLYQNLNDYYAYGLSFQFAFPLFEITSPAIKTKLNLAKEKKLFSYLEIMQQVDVLIANIKPLEKKKEKDINPEEKKWGELAVKYFTYPDAFRDNPIHIIPSFSHDKPIWISPWQVLAFENTINLVKNELENINRMVISYRQGDQAGFAEALKDFKSLVNERSKDHYNIRQVKTELIYNNLDPFYFSKVGYGLSMIFILMSFMFWAEKPKRRLYLLSFFTLSVGWFFNVLGMVMRMYINSRPPITNLFETFIFVAAVGVVLCFLIEKVNKKGLGIISGSIAGLVLLLISGRFGADGDTIQVMQAVLDSNFWLATHVVTINLGYAGVVIAGLVGHFYLFEKLKKNPNESELNNIVKVIYGTLAFGFIFVFTGTVLGGIWADQSWGRFWGWDPKENGALLIALWCLILFHSRIGGIINPTFFCAGAIFGIVVVMWAWFGINLLGVGLHSYGFIDGIFSRLVFYTFIQIALVLGLLAVIVARENKMPQ